MTEQPDKYGHTPTPEWLKKYGLTSHQLAHQPLEHVIHALTYELVWVHDRIARLEAGQRDLEARLGDGE